jgi:Tesmin/TSO1-like CXC domain, cysteine-rich domain
MIVASRSPPDERNHGTMPDAVPGIGIVNQQGTRFTTTATGTPDIYPKRIFADDPSVENQPTTRFRLPPRYRNGQSDDRSDGHVGKERIAAKAASDTMTSAIPDAWNKNHRHFHEIPIGSENPNTAVQYHPNAPQRDGRQVPSISSWTAVAAGTAEQGHPTAWRRHYLEDTSRIQTAPIGKQIPVYADARSNTRDKVPSIPIRHEVLLSDMRSVYTIGASVPQSMGIFQQPPPPGMRHMPPIDLSRDRTIPPPNNAIQSSRNTNVPMNMNNANASQYTIPGNSNHGDRMITTSSNASENCVHERFRWRHPNGRIYEQVHVGVPPPVAVRESEPYVATRFMHPHASRSSNQPYITANPADTHVKSGQVNVLSSDRTNQPRYGSTAPHRTLSRHVASQGQEEQHYQKNQPPRQPTVAPPVIQPPVFEKVKGFDKLDLLCTATLEIGELHDNPTGCSCPKSKCVALYCDCFKAGRRCHPNRCSCLNCKNTIAESGIDGARTKAIRNILARNPRAFNTAGMGNPLHKLPPGEVACNCVRSKCLKLYCSCFHHGKLCRPDICTCVGCENILSTDDTGNGNREAAIQHVIEKRADAFVIKPKVMGQGCACKNNKCLRKYCECYRTGLRCNPNKCTCRDCENRPGTMDGTNDPNGGSPHHAPSQPVVLMALSHNELVK